jgi:hypothetical protein
MARRSVNAPRSSESASGPPPLGRSADMATQRGDGFSLGMAIGGWLAARAERWNERLRSAEHRSARAPKAHDRLAKHAPSRRSPPSAPALLRCGPARISPASEHVNIVRAWLLASGSRGDAARVNEPWLLGVVGGGVYQNGGGPPCSKTLARSSCAVQVLSVLGVRRPSGAVAQYSSC